MCTGEHGLFAGSRPSRRKSCSGTTKRQTLTFWPSHMLQPSHCFTRTKKRAAPYFKSLNAINDNSGIREARKNCVIMLNWRLNVTPHLFLICAKGQKLHQCSLTSSTSGPTTGLKVFGDKNQTVHCAF